MLYKWKKQDERDPKMKVVREQMMKSTFQLLVNGIAKSKKPRLVYK